MFLHTLRVYGPEPLYSLLWTHYVSVDMLIDIAWSPSNRFAVSMAIFPDVGAQVWDSSFHLVHEIPGCLDLSFFKINGSYPRIT